MAELRDIFLVRHGDYDDDTLHLNDVGRKQAHNAAEVLTKRWHISGTPVFTSWLHRAIETADIIAQGLSGDGAKAIQSEALALAGNHPEVVKELGTLVCGVVNKVAPELEAESPIVVVTHAPLIAVAMDISTGDVRYGGVYRYDPSVFNNPFYRPRYEAGLDSLIASSIEPSQSAQVQ
jgi:phosphohistidine phosphatase SixA